jgi:hypothetical protein
MKFIPMTDEELARSSLLEAGVYPFEVLTAEDTVSKAGNEMIKIKLVVYGNDGQQAHVYDYLMAHSEKVMFKLRHFCEMAGLIAAYEAGTLDALQCFGKQGYVKIAIRNGDAQFGPKNEVKDYVVKADKAPSTPALALDLPRKLTPDEFNQKHGIGGEKFDDDIPFSRFNEFQP